jgi:hypothetical protein
MKSKISKKVVYSSDTLVVDGDGVAVKKSIKSFVSKGADVFYRVYVEHVGLINRLPPSEMKFLHAIAALVDWDTNEIAFTGTNNEKICSLGDMTDATRRSCLSRLCKKGFLRKVSYLCYQLNPTIFFKGTDVERANILSLEYVWEIDGLKEKKKKSAVKPNEEYL